MTPAASPRVLIIGYSPSISGGVTGVTATLIDSLNGIELYPILFVYSPAWKSACLTLWSLLKLPLKILWYRAEILHVIVGSKGDVVRTLPAILIGRLMGRKVIIQFHKSVPAILPVPSSRMDRLVRFMWRNVSAFFFLSPSLSAEFDSVVCTGPRKHVIPNALGPGWMGIPAPPLAERDKDVVFFGRWSEEKGATDLLKVFSDHTEAGAQVRLPVCHVYSDGHPGKDTAFVRFHDWLPEEGVRSVLCSARIMILPSYVEAYPTVLLEAAACGTPFVSTNVAGIPDIARDSAAGLVCAPGDIEGLRSSVQTLACDDGLWLRLSVNGRAWAQQQEPNRIAAMWRDAYGTVVADC